ncbi:MAG: HlyC/CorC family transporter [Dehalococcoidia bacterium]|nr:HlyC/CorC family transporter [Dehalococcoidia bacterium]
MVTLYLVLLALMVVASAFFSSSEAAFLSLRRVMLYRMLRQQTRGAHHVVRLAERPERRLLPLILLGNTLVNTTAAALATAVVLTYLSERTGLIVATFGATALLLVLGEVIPKALGVRHPEAVTGTFIYPLLWLERALLPGVLVLQGVAHLALRFSGRAAAPGDVTEEEIRVMVSAGQEAGTIVRREAELVANVFRFGDRKAREVMTARTQVAWVRDGMTATEFLAFYHSRPQARYPVFKGRVDQVTGVLAARDVLKVIASGQLSGNAPVTSIALPPFFTPDTKLLIELLDEMRAAGAELAIAIDEHGGVAGTVDKEQILEPLVGLVGAGATDGAKDVVFLNEETVELSGDLTVDEVNARVDLALPEGLYLTVAGLVLDRLGRIPSEGESVRVGNLVLRVARMKGRRITRVQVHRPGEAQTAIVDRSVV